jgi:hypothetical protein
MQLTHEQLLEALSEIERIIGETTVADGITAEKENGWRRVIEQLTQLSIKDARRMGEGLPPVDKGSYTLPSEQWVHMRVLAMILELSTWMGMQWRSHFPGLTKDDYLREIERAYDTGEAFESRQRKT